MLFNTPNNVTFASIKVYGRIVTLSLLLVFSLFAFRHAYFMGYVRLQKDNFRKQLLSLPQQQFKVLALPAEALFKNKAGFEWKEKNKELVINGHYFEVVTYTVTNGIANITLLADEAETNLFSAYFSHLHNHKNSHWHLLLSLLSVQLIDSTSKFSFTKRIAESLHYKTIELDLSEGCRPKILLPPKVS